MAIKLIIEDIDAGYGAVRALHGVSLSIDNGQTVALLGTNGNGKSTLMKCVMGMVKPDKGSIRLEMDGETHDLTKLSTEEIVNLGVALIPEGRRLFPKLTVEENLLLGAFRESSRPKIPENMAFCFEAFPLLKERRTQLAGSMSGGQQQMLAIARALMSSPRLLLVDEPSVGLSPLLVSQTITKLKELKAILAAAEQPVAIDPTLAQLRADAALSTTQLANQRLTGAQDLAWAIINNPSFLFNR